MEQEIACPGSNGNVVLRVESIPFSRLPGQSKLFLDYQNDPLSLSKYYPSSVDSHTKISERIPEVLEHYRVDRTSLCDALDDINREYNTGDKAIQNIGLLRDPQCVAVVTGQQAGLFTGPLYTIYKALSAVKAAECLRARGFKAVPVFWAATEDHDFEEVSETFVLDADSHLASVRTHVGHRPDVPVGDIEIDASMSDTIDSLFGLLKHTEFTNDLRSMLEHSCSTGRSFGAAFGQTVSAICASYGLVIIDPLHPELKELASPIYIEAIRRSDEIVQAVRARSDELVASGYEAQVAVTEDHFPLFWHDDDGRRLSLRKNVDGMFKAKGAAGTFTREQLLDIAASEPERFSPNVMLRAVVQDYILPTVCYFGGGAEISYFAQNSEVYRVLRRPVTPILHRQSFTVVEAKHRRTLESYDLHFADLFRGLNDLLQGIVDEHLDRDTARTFAEVEEIINTQLNRLDRELSSIDVTLAANLATRRRKIIYHIGALREKFRRVQLRKDETVHRRISALFDSLHPEGGLQERTLNITYFLNQYGPNFSDWIYDAVDLDDRGHRVVYL